MSFKADILFLDEPGWVRIHLKRGSTDIIITYDIYSQNRHIFQKIVVGERADFDGLMVTGEEEGTVTFVFATKFTCNETVYPLKDCTEAFLDIDEWINDYINAN